MEDDSEDEEKPGSPIAKYIRSELRSMRKQNSSETSMIDFNDNEAKKRTHYEIQTNYLGIGPSYRGTGIYDEPFFDPEVKVRKSVKHKPEDPTFGYEILLGYSDIDQVDKVKKALLETTTVLKENTCEPTKDLVKLLKLLRDAHPPERKPSATREEKKADALREKLAHSHLYLVYKLKIECHNMDQIKLIEEAVLDSSVIVFASVTPTFQPEPELEPTLKTKVKERIKIIFNLGPLG